LEIVTIIWTNTQLRDEGFTLQQQAYLIHSYSTAIRSARLFRLEKPQAEAFSEYQFFPG